jgi:hypothetical protein
MDDDLNMQPDLRHLRQKVGLRPLTISKIRRLSTEAHARKRLASSFNWLAWGSVSWLALFLTLLGLLLQLC